MTFINTGLESVTSPLRHSDQRRTKIQNKAARIRKRYEPLAPLSSLVSRAIQCRKSRQFLTVGHGHGSMRIVPVMMNRRTVKPDHTVSKHFLPSPIIVLRTIPGIQTVSRDLLDVLMSCIILSMDCITLFILGLSQTRGEWSSIPRELPRAP